MKKDKLTLKQKKFCQLYTEPGEFFGNGVQSYVEAYNIDTSKKGWYAAARASASENLTKPNILKEINRILEDQGLNDSFVDKQLLFMITQNADLKAKMSAIAEYNKMKSRIGAQKIDITSQGKPIIGMKYVIPGNDSAH